MLREELKNITTTDLLVDKKISVRTRNCCMYANLNTLFDIVEYFESGRYFCSIRNLGKKSCLELVNICKEYIPQIELFDNADGLSKEEQQHQHQKEIENLIKTDLINSINKGLIKGEDILSYFDKVKNEILKNQYLSFIENYSNRTKNRLREISYGEFLTDFLFSPDNAFLKIDGVGRTSLEELVDLKHKIARELFNLVDLSEDKTLQFKKLVSQKGDIILDSFVEDFYMSNNHLPMFWILEQQLTKSKNHIIEIFISSFPILKNHQLSSLQELANKYGLSRERVRQLRNYVFHKFFDYTSVDVEDTKIYYNDISKLKKLIFNKEDWVYVTNVIKDPHYVYYASYDIESLMEHEQCTFSVEFVMQLIAYIFNDEYKLYGGFDTNNRDNLWKAVFLIKKDYADIFDLEGIRGDFCRVLTDKHSEYLLDIEEYIRNSQRWINFDYDKIDIITSIVKDLLLHEFGLYTEEVGENQIKIPANKDRNPSEVVYEILQTRGEQMHLEEIFVEFKKNMPEHKYSEENNADRLRPSLQKNEEITYRKRNSIYLLKKWEHIRSGTIRNAITEFLFDKDLPQKLDTITEYVRQYFPETNNKSIHSSMASGKNFILFKDNLYGLVSKDYPIEYEILVRDEQRKSFEQRLYDLEKFIAEHGHFPFYNSDGEEISLYYWWRRINKNSKNLTELQKIELERIKRQYSDYEIDKSMYEWLIQYNRLKSFVIENQKIPSLYSNDSERELYEWYIRTISNFLNLNDKQRGIIIEINKLISDVIR